MAENTLPPLTVKPKQNPARVFPGRLISCLFFSSSVIELRSKKGLRHFCKKNFAIAFQDFLHRQHRQTSLRNRNQHFRNFSRQPLLAQNTAAAPPKDFEAQPTQPSVLCAKLERQPMPAQTGCSACFSNFQAHLFLCFLRDGVLVPSDILSIGAMRNAVRVVSMFLRRGAI